MTNWWRAASKILRGHGHAMQSAVLADLLAKWIAGHRLDVVPLKHAAADQRRMLVEFRKAVLDEHVALVRALLPIADAEFDERLAKAGDET